MRAFIFNSGRGSRLGALTAAQPKALVPLANGETLLSRQLRLLGKAGVGDVVISPDGCWQRSIRRRIWRRCGAI